MAAWSAVRWADAWAAEMAAALARWWAVATVAATVVSWVGRKVSSAATMAAASVARTALLKTQFWRTNNEADGDEAQRQHDASNERVQVVVHGRKHKLGGDFTVPARGLPAAGGAPQYPRS